MVAMDMEKPQGSERDINKLEIKNIGLGVYELKRNESVIDNNPEVITVIPSDDGVKVELSNKMGLKGELFLYREEWDAISKILSDN